MSQAVFVPAASSRFFWGFFLCLFAEIAVVIPRFVPSVSQLSSEKSLVKREQQPDPTCR